MCRLKIAKRNKESGYILQAYHKIDDDIEFDDDSLTDPNFDTDLVRFIEECLETPIQKYLWR